MNGVVAEMDASSAAGVLVISELTIRVASSAAGVLVISELTIRVNGDIRLILH